ncbi:hypothetical protein NDU88_005666 [Pleurodeles waltl]|uniref:Uncharacterized protein n=1 Tax=Pleurodeles waltl TaxID=8319 RepID=A0AAV7UKS7_PLEWA|nr:hypothetical protein NDU88_005666 [Pleurodeles waltl]
MKEKEETRDLWERRDQQNNSKPEGQRSDQEAERHCNWPRSGESMAFSGKTLLIPHTIKTQDGKIVRLRPYRIPEARRQVLEQEF